MAGQVIAGSIVELCVNALTLRYFRFFSSVLSSFNSASTAFLVYNALKAKAGARFGFPAMRGRPLAFW